MIRRGSVLLLITVLFLLSGLNGARSQVLVESVAAIVGNEVIYLSDIENMILDLRSSGNRVSTDELRCRVLRELLIQKLFLDQARIDSIEITDDMVESEVNSRINDAIRRSGSEEALESYFKKSMIEIRRDIRDALVDQEIVNQVQSAIAENIKITPNELRKFYASIPKDSLPVIPSRVQISIIQIDPPENDENKAEARQKLLDIRGQILAGKSFSALAALYSEDPQTAPRGGELGFMLRGELEKPYADEAFSLTKNTVSKIIETRYGFHIIQMIERNGDLLNTRHILIRPKVKPEQVTKAMNELDSLANLIRKDSIKFEDVARRYSTHKDSRINGGKFVSTNPSKRETWFTLEELNPQMYVQVRDLNVGEISDPFRTLDENNNDVFRIVRLDNEVPAHRANLKDDYQMLSDAALMDKRTRTYDDWIKKKIKITYIKVSDEFRSCDFLKDGWLK